MRVYALKPERVRLYGTTVSGYHAGGKDSLFQYGYSKDDPTLKQVKVMMASLDPFGMPLVSDVVAGNAAEDKLYIPAVARVVKIIDGLGLLFVGDSKMSALAIRAHIHQLNQHSLCPLAQTGDTPEEMGQWVKAVEAGEKTLQAVSLEDEKGQRKLLAEGYAFERTVQTTVPSVASETSPAKEQALEWREQVFVVRAESYRKRLLDGLEKRLQQATNLLLALTPPPGRGKRQIQDENALFQAADSILKTYGVKDFLTYTFERQEKRQTKYIGRGRGNAERPKREIIRVRYQMLTVTRQEETLAAHQKTLGWRAYVSDAPADQLTLEQAVLTYRDEWIIERGFHRLKGVPLSLDPLFVRNDDQVIGITNLLSIAVRMLTLIEFVVRRKLQQNQEKLPGLIENNPKKGLDNPTTERLLKVFDCERSSPSI